MSTLDVPLETHIHHTSQAEEEITCRSVMFVAVVVVFWFDWEAEMCLGNQRDRL
jgi:hypothetical protein